MGFGKMMMRRAEYIARKNNFKRIAVIAGIGTREYYKKRGYHLDGTYMVKDLRPMIGFGGLELEPWQLVLAMIVLAIALTLICKP